jgi:hypothetical protein
LVQQLTGAWMRQYPRKRTVSLFAVATLGVAHAVVGGLRVANGATAAVITGYGGECVDVAAASSADGTVAQTYTCDGTAAKKWTATNGQPGVKAGSDECLDAAGPSCADGAPAQIWTCAGAPNRPRALPTGNTTSTPGRHQQPVRSLGNPDPRRRLIPPGRSWTRHHRIGGVKRPRSTSHIPPRRARSRAQG